MDSSKKIGAQLLIGIGTAAVVFPYLLLLNHSVAMSIGDLFLIFGLVISPLGMLCIITGEVFVWKRIRAARHSGIADAEGQLKLFGIIGIVAIAIYIVPQVVMTMRSKQSLQEYYRQERANDPNYCVVQYWKDKGIDWSATQQVAKNKKEAGCPDIIFKPYDTLASEMSRVVPKISPQTHASFQVEAKGSSIIRVYDIDVPLDSAYVLVAHPDGTLVQSVLIYTSYDPRKEIEMDLSGVLEEGKGDIIVTLMVRNTVGNNDYKNDSPFIGDDGKPVSKSIKVF